MTKNESKPRTVEVVKRQLEIAQEFLMISRKCQDDGPERTEAMRVIAELKKELEELTRPETNQF